MGATTLVVDFAKVCEKFQLTVMWRWPMNFWVSAREQYGSLAAPLCSSEE